MSNKSIAINWAVSMIRQHNKMVHSDQFFKPFTNISTRKKIATELAKKGVTLFTDGNLGAFLFKTSDSRLKVIVKNNLKAGVWVDGANVIMLPATDLTGVVMVDMPDDLAAGAVDSI